MTRNNVLLTAGLFLAAILTSQIRAGVQPGHQPKRAPQIDMREVVPHTLMVKLRPSALNTSGGLSKPAASVNTALSDAGATAVRQMFPGPAVPGKNQGAFDDAGISRIFIVELSASIDLPAAAQRLSLRPDVEYAEPKYYNSLCDFPNDSLVTSQGDVFTRLHAYDAWTLAKGSASVVVAVIDGGTYWRHADLAGNVHVRPGEDINHNGVYDAGDLNGVDDDANGFVDDVVGWNFANNSGDPTGLSATPQSFAHGTATASHCCAVTNNLRGMAGTSWNCGLMPVCAGSPSSDNSIAYGYEGIVYAFRNGASVINCSWGRQGGFSQFEQDVITAATNAGVLVVAAAGNEAADNDLVPHYPSGYDGVLAVGATNSTNDLLASFSNYGRTVEVYAPGVNILSAFTNGGYGSGGSGTSYSSPLVAGLAGILRAAHPDWTPAQVAAQIRSTADPIDNLNYSYAGRLGRGRANFYRALTESHAALDLAHSSLLTARGGKLFLLGDTLVLSLRLRNVGALTASSCEVVVASSDSALVVLEGAATIGGIAPGEAADVPGLRFRVGPLSDTREVVIRALWTYNGTEQDGAVFRATIFPSAPLWLLKLDGAPASLFSVSAVDRSTVWAAGGDGGASSPLIIRSTDAGTTWEDAGQTLQNLDFYCINAIDAQRAWVGTGNGLIYATTDGGAQWAAQSYPGRQSPFINGIRMFPSGVGYAMGDPPGDGKFVVLKTTDFGVTWAHLPSEPGLSSTEAGWNNSFWWTDEQHGWFGSNKNRIWRTTDGGANWAAGASGGTNSYGVTFSNASTGFAAHAGGYLARSTDGGASWSPVSLPTSSMLTAVSCVVGGQAAWVTDGADPFHTRDNGTSWMTEALYPYSGSINHMSFADTTFGWAVTSNGEVLCYDALTYTKVKETELPRELVLEQNYPNPFNPTTSMRYSLGVVSREGLVAARVRLAVYDLLGREVAVLVDEQKQPGEYTASWNATGMPSGVYFYRLDAGGSRMTKKMILLK